MPHIAESRRDFTKNFWLVRKGLMPPQELAHQGF
jgi:hypothetical protein